jgi:hypothetical protein
MNNGRTGKKLFTAFILGTTLHIGYCSAAAQDDSLESKIALKCPDAASWLKAEETRHSGLAKAGAKVTPSAPALQKELIAMAARDTKARTPFQAEGEHHSDALLKPVQEVDRINLARVKAIVKSQGFPTEAQVGPEGIDAAMLLIQHSDADPDFQQSVLASLQPRAGKDISGDTFAMLEDRVSVRQGRPQRYGSQLGFKDGHLVPERPIGDLKEVDKRRESVGLMPLQSYICMVGALQS